MKKFLAIILVVVFAFSACGGKESSDSKGTAGGDAATYLTVNGETITNADYSKVYDMYLNNLAAQNMLADRVKEVMVRNTVLMQDVKKNAVEVTDAKIKEDYDAAVKQAGGKEAYLAMLAQYGITEEQDKENRKINSYYMAHQEWYTKEHPVSEEDLKKYYEENKESLDKVNASHILVETEAEAKAVKDRLDKGEDFAEIAKEVSKDEGTKAGGGALGEAPASKYVPEFSEAVLKLNKGEISEPVKTTYGYHIIKLESKKDSFEDSKDEINTILSGQNYNTYLEDLYKNAEVKSPADESKEKSDKDSKDGDSKEDDKKEDEKDGE